MSGLDDSSWNIVGGVAGLVGAVTGVAALSYVVWDKHVGPQRRRHQLAEPCNVHFTIRSLQEVPLDYVLQDNERHHVEELVLPPNKLVPIEIGYHPRIHFHEVEFIFGCEGGLEEKPFATALRGQFSETRKRATYTDVHKFMHVSTDTPRGVGTHYVHGFELQTKSVGLYPVSVSFVTNEVEGNAKLLIRVEEEPATRMACLRHKHCSVRPYRC